MEILRSFNLNNPDPVYVFVLPDGQNQHNKTVVFRKSNFNEAVFPNVTSLQRQLTKSNISKLITLIENIDKIAPILLNTFNVNNKQHLKNKKQHSYNNHATKGDLDEAESLRIVDENVRTERNFLRFMQELNGEADTNYVNNYYQWPNGVSTIQNYDEYDNLASTDINIRNGPHYRPSSQIDYTLAFDYTTTPRPQSTTTVAVNWKDLGLDGWTGGIKEPGKSFEETRQ